MHILNLTIHQATPEQMAAGVADVAPAYRDALALLLTFDAPPDRAELARRAGDLANLATGWDAAMIGGAPYLMGPLERALAAAGKTALYSFSRRESVEQTQPDGSVRKVAVFRHAGWVEA